MINSFNRLFSFRKGITTALLLLITCHLKQRYVCTSYCRYNCFFYSVVNWSHFLHKKIVCTLYTIPSSLHVQYGVSDCCFSRCETENVAIYFSFNLLKKDPSRHIMNAFFWKLHGLRRDRMKCLHIYYVEHRWHNVKNIRNLWYC